MKYPLLFITLVFALLGCSRSGDKSQSGNLGAFIIERTQTFGAHPHTTDLPALHADWRYNQTSDITGRKVRITLDGDHIPELQTFLLSAFGAPVLPVKTNDTGFVVGVFGADGVAIQISGEDAKDGKRLTRIAIQGPSAP